MSGTVHVVGAGLAGLAAAIDLSERGRRVVLSEAAPAPGGRCRSLDDPAFAGPIDNGNHLVLTGNAATRGHLRRIGAEQALVAAPEAAFPFVDLADGARWTVSAGRGRLPVWLADRRRRPPGTQLRDFAPAARLATAGSGATVADVVTGRGAAWRRFWHPLTLAVLNAPPDRASARLLWAALARTFLRGGRSSRPMVAPRGLGAALIDPAVELLARRGVAVRRGRRLRGVATDGARVTALTFTDGEARLGTGDHVILAVAADALPALCPDLAPPTAHEAILNAHFRLPHGAARHAPPLLGVLSAEAQWIFRRGDTVSVTVSAAGDSDLLAAPPARVAAALWPEVRRALGLATCAPLAHRVIKEKRATFAQSPEQVAKRLPTQTRLANLVLAGDHVDTGLPASIEGAIRSGRTAAAELRAADRPPPRPRRSGDAGRKRAR